MLACVKLKRTPIARPRDWLLGPGQPYEAAGRSPIQFLTGYVDGPHIDASLRTKTTHWPLSQWLPHLVQITAFYAPQQYLHCKWSPGLKFIKENVTVCISFYFHWIFHVNVIHTLCHEFIIFKKFFEESHCIFFFFSSGAIFLAIFTIVE